MYRLVIDSSQIQQRQISLQPTQQHYLLRVLRLGNGDRFIAMNGEGQAWLAAIYQSHAQILETIYIETELPIALSLITALPKAKGYEQIIRCGTELGVSSFIPVLSDRTILKPSPQKVERWRKIATEAAEQSERQIVPAVLDPTSFIDAINQDHSSQHKYICVARQTGSTLWQALSPPGTGNIIIATGCEGGWTPQEVAMAQAQGYLAVSLGKRILRGVTAPIVAASVVMAKLDN